MMNVDPAYHRVNQLIENFDLSSEQATTVLANINQDDCFTGLNLTIPGREIIDKKIHELYRQGKLGSLCYWVT